MRGLVGEVFERKRKGGSERMEIDFGAIGYLIFDIGHWDIMTYDDDV